MVVPLALPVVDLAVYMADPTSAAAKAEAAKAADALKSYGALLVRDPRVPEGANGEFLDMMEQYFEQPLDAKMADVRPELNYQIGATPEFVEEPCCFRDPKCQKILEDLPAEDKPVQWTGADPKWRFFHRIGPVPTESKYPQLNTAPVVPAKFADKWLSVMDTYGQQLHDAVEMVAEVAAVGLGYADAKDFVNKAKFGPHLLAPTGSDLCRFNQLNTVFAGFHYDLNFLTIHGKSRYPGLHVWARNSGIKMSVAVPDGCLLVQAGKELEWLTGGAVLAGYHEVIVNEKTIEAAERAKAAGRSLWRVSSTLFYHIASDVVLKPTGPFDEPERNAAYPAVDCGEYVRKELELISLAEGSGKPSQ
ncbi:hypothetical protein H9P43_001292 [Blastocladiella emersonii ATCC 22665]|nr:hypothetical protein H9P43_001290 [Blastocladiella emersonii ATCC 22665]KAI9189859.1 hypothetical protein H9P43_001292 [Blastocladiella emersonii ATCC 22665]